MNNEPTSAKCRLCDRMLGKRQMTKHLKACWEHHTVAVPGKATPRRFHLVVEARHGPDYWLHLQASAKCTFGDLDSVLRSIWLECCDHLSAFEFPVKRKLHRHATRNDIAALFQQLVREAPPSFSDDDASDDELMDKPLGSKLEGEFCDAWAGRHDCGEEMLAPLINSPRTGVCGYGGPSVEP